TFRRRASAMIERPASAPTPSPIPGSKKPKTASIPSLILVPGIGIASSSQCVSKRAQDGIGSGGEAPLDGDAGFFGGGDAGLIFVLRARGRHDGPAHESGGPAGPQGPSRGGRGAFGRDRSGALRAGGGWARGQRIGRSGLGGQVRRS